MDTPSKRLRAVLVEPDAVARAAEKAALENDFAVTDVGSPDEAIRLDGEFALAVVEHRLGDATGSSLLARLVERHPEIHRILLAGKADAAALEALTQGVAERLLLRPFRGEELRVAARRVCDREGHLGRVLCIDDDALFRAMIGDTLRRGGYEVVTAADGDQGLLRARPGRFDVAVVDLNVPGPSGVELVERLKSIDPDLVLLVVTATASSELASELLRRGAYDYITKPYRDADLLFRIGRALWDKRREEELRRLRRESQGSYGPVRIVGKSPAIRRLFAMIESVADSDSTVLLTGETGTGKELVAQAIHHRSARRAGPMLPVNCGALAETLLESELFGHEKGAFTGALRQKKGLFELADRGTLFLDEVAELNPTMQGKILRVLQTREFMRVGGQEVLRADVRVIAATHRVVERMVEAGQFRQDLFFRLNVLTLHLPPLRERREDIPVIVDALLSRLSQQLRRRIERVGPAAMEVLLAHDWPGNVRELENALERAGLLCGGPVIERVDLGGEEREPARVRRLDTRRPLKESLDEAAGWLEVEYLTQMLRTCRGNVKEAAERAGIDRKSFYRKMDRYGIRPEAFRDEG